jgi:chromosome segregation ATPase
MMNQAPIPPEPLPIDVAGLLKLIADPKAAQQRYDRLTAAFEQARQVVSQAHAEIAKLEAERAAQHELLETRRAEADYALARERADLAQQRSDLERQAQELASDRERLERREEYLAMVKREARELAATMEAFEAKYANAA